MAKGLLIKQEVQSADYQLALNKLAEARKAIILNDDFLASLIYKLTVKLNPAIHSARTDGRTIEFNPSWILERPLLHVVGLYAHEIGHPALGHPWRLGDRDIRYANIAGDHVVNLMNEGRYYVGDNWVMDPRYEGWSMERIYDSICGEKEEEPTQAQPDGRQTEEGDSSHCSTHCEPVAQTSDNSIVSADDESEDEAFSGLRDGSEACDKNLSEGAQQVQSPDQRDQGEDQTKADQADNGQGSVEPESFTDFGDFLPAPEDSEQDRIDWKVSTSQALVTAKAAGNDVSHIEKIVKASWEGETEPDLTDFLRDFVNDVAKNDYRWYPPNKRFIHQGLYLPSCISEKITEAVIAVDVSGSINDDQFQMFIEKINGILEHFDIELYVVFCSNYIHAIERYTQGDFPLRITTRGSGGTSYIPVFDWIRSDHIFPSCLIYFTDLQCSDYPDHDPRFPVLWAWNDEPPYYVQDKEAYRKKHPMPDMPYGRVVQVK